MPDLVLPIVTVTLVLLLATSGLVLAGDRTKFPKRMQGGGGHANLETEQVNDEDDE